MADVTGALHVEFSGRSYSLRLTMRGLAGLQGRFGRDLGGVMDQAVGLPDFNVVLAVVETALSQGSPGLSDDEVQRLADEMTTADPAIVGRIVSAAFPEAANEGKPDQAEGA